MPLTVGNVLKKRPITRTGESNNSEPNKKRNTDNSSSISVQEFYAIEDRDALSRSQKTDESTFLNECQALKTTIRRFAENPPDNANNEELKTQMTLHMMLMRRLNRLGHFRLRKMKDRLAQQRLKVEEQHLQLQNLCHQVGHLHKEVNRCLEFKSADQDLSLVPTEEFFELAPNDISKPDVTINDDHQLRLARLNWEMEERKCLSKNLQELQARKDLLASDISGKEQRLESLKPMIQSILDTAKPAQEMMGIKLEVEAQQRELANYLPKEMSVIGVQAKAYKEITNDSKFDVIYEGNIDEAKRFETNLPEKSAFGSPDDSDSGDDDDDEEEEEEGVVAESVKRGKHRSTVSEAVEKRRDSILEAHPVRVVLRIQCQDNAKIVLTFYYLNELRVISTKSRLLLEGLEIDKSFLSPGNLLHEESLLQNIFPGDTGLYCPNPMGQAKLEHLLIDYSKFAIQTGHLFHWAQQLALIRLVDSTMDSCTKLALDKVQICDFLQNVVAKIRTRVQTRLSLREQIQNMESLRISLPRTLMSLFPNKIIARLTSSKSLTCDDFCAHPATQSVLSSINYSPPLDGWFFSVQMERGEAKLVCLMQVPPEYPDRTPLFVLLLKWKGVRTASDCDQLRTLEESVNIWWPRSILLKHRVNTLNLQLQYLLSRMDVFLETESARLVNHDFNRDHLFGRKTRGPDRQMPFSYKETSNSFAFL